MNLPQWCRLLGLLWCTTLLVACGGSGGRADALSASAPTPAPDTGQLLITITDAEGDFARYAIDVEAITLERADGDRIETLPIRTRIDFVELVEVTEFLSLATVPAGRYTAVSLSLDYRDADLVVQTKDGTLHDAVAVDGAGAPLGRIDVRLELAETDPIRIAPGVAAAFSLDFDLDASNDIDLSLDPPQVTVAPVFFAAPELEATRDHRIRGLLEAVEVATGVVSLDLRPFRTTRTRFGSVRFRVDDDTRYEIDGIGYVGADGLSALAGLPTETPLIAQGPASGRDLVADRVVAGSSVPWSDADALQGVITARSGDLLEVAGVRVLRADQPERFRNRWTLLLGPDTVVSAPGEDPAALDASRISVGQRIVASGRWQDETRLDASTGRVRLQRSTLTGTVVGLDPLAVDLLLLDGRRPERFDFAGTGPIPADDADPDAYEIDTGTLALPLLAIGDQLRIRGLVPTFGSEPPDFTAGTVQALAPLSRASALRAFWPEGEAMPFTSIAPDRLLLDLEHARVRFRIGLIPGFVVGRPIEFPLVAPEQTGAYAVRVRGDGALTLFRRFDDLVSALEAELSAGHVLYRAHASGRLPAPEDGLETHRALFEFASVPAEE
ncbi:MAG: DUF4382 domain-containing protein [Pseudomonadales bacterium]|jgi:hypothetical protein|nr:DUF4382 domain-containing protein [Pseudomonadales bacterium]